MAEIKAFGLPVRRLRADASAHVQRFRSGKRVQSGRGLAFWFNPDGASITEIPMDDRDLPFLFNSRSRDFQEITVQGVVVWRVANPEALGDRIDFTIDLKQGAHVGQPVDQIDALLTGLAQQLAAQYLAENDVNALLSNGIRPIQERLEMGMTGGSRLGQMGLEVVNVRVADVSPSSELKRALQTPTFERLQQQADQATFERRALAVEKERAIAENELQNQIELAKRQKELIEREDANSRNRAMADAASKKIASDAEAERIRTVEQAKADMEKARVMIYSELGPEVMLGMAAQEFAGKLKTIEHLNVSPDMLSTLLTDFLGRSGARKTIAAQPKAEA